MGRSSHLPPRHPQDDDDTSDIMWLSITACNDSLMSDVPAGSAPMDRELEDAGCPVQAGYSTQVCCLLADIRYC